MVLAGFVTNALALLGFAVIYHQLAEELRDTNNKLRSVHQEYAQLLLPVGTESAWVRCTHVTHTPLDSRDPRSGLWCLVASGVAQSHAPVPPFAAHDSAEEEGEPSPEPS